MSLGSSFTSKNRCVISEVGNELAILKEQSSSEMERAMKISHKVPLVIATSFLLSVSLEMIASLRSSKVKLTNLSRKDGEGPEPFFLSSTKTVHQNLSL